MPSNSLTTSKSTIQQMRSVSNNPPNSRPTSQPTSSPSTKLTSIITTTASASSPSNSPNPGQISGIVIGVTASIIIMMLILRNYLITKPLRWRHRQKVEIGDETINILHNTNTNVESNSHGDFSKSDIKNDSFDPFSALKSTIVYEDINGERGSILKYDSVFLITIGWCIPRAGSIFAWYEILFLCTVLCGIATAIAFASCTVYQNTDKCLHLPTADVKFLTLITLCSFVMAFFANIIFQRWWSIRLHLQQFMGSALNLAVNLSTVMSSSLRLKSLLPSASDSEIDHARSIANRINAMCILSFRYMLNNTRGDKNIKDLIEKGIISAKEYNYFKSLPSQNSVYCCQVMSQQLQEALDRGLLGNISVQGNNFVMMSQNIMDLRAAVSMAETYVNVQIPYPFVQIVAFVVFTFLIQLLLVCSSFIAVGLADPTKDGELVTGYLTIILYSVVLVGLLKLHEVLSNPLGDDTADFPAFTYLKNFEETLCTITSNGFQHFENDCHVENNSRNNLMSDDLYDDTRVSRHDLRQVKLP